MTGQSGFVIPADFFSLYPPQLRPVAPPVFLGNAGGLSGSRLWRFDAPVGPVLIRRWPGGTTWERLVSVHRWVARLGAAIPEVAEPLPDRTGRTFSGHDGHLWELTHFLPGAADLVRPPDRQRLATMFATLARVHEALGDEATLAPSPGLIARRDELRQLIAWEFDHLRQVVAAQVASEVKTQAAAWLNQAQRFAPQAARPCTELAAHLFRLQPVLRDARPDHFLFNQDDLTGLVDFGAMGVDSVAGDLARLLGEVMRPDDSTRRSALAAYQGVRPLSAEEVGLIAAFEAGSAVLGGARWVRWHFVERRRFDDPDAVVRGLERAFKRLDDWIRSDQLANFPRS